MPDDEFLPNVMAASCPSRVILEHLTSRWGVLVLIALRDKTLRFSELRRRIQGVSEKMLSQTLRTLEEDGFVVRTAWPEVPPRVEYHLSPLGEEAAAHVAALGGWIERSLPLILYAQRAANPRSS
jgi:DNA-binding HxlR family transcriptional regulator